MNQNKENDAKAKEPMVSMTEAEATALRNKAILFALVLNGYKVIAKPDVENNVIKVQFWHQNTKTGPKAITEGTGDYGYTHITVDFNKQEWSARYTDNVIAKDVPQATKDVLASFTYIDKTAGVVSDLKAEIARLEAKVAALTPKEELPV